MTCNRNRLHCQFNRNRRLLSRLNLEILYPTSLCDEPGFLGGFLRIPRISNRVPRIRENYHRVPKIWSLQIHTGT